MHTYMKFKLEPDLNEKFSTEYSKNSHYNQHVLNQKQYRKIDSDEYERIADELAVTPVDYKTIFGYETTAPDGDTRKRFAKYNSETGDFVVYGLDSNGTPVIISLHKKTMREYNIDKAIKYLGEIPA